MIILDKATGLPIDPQRAPVDGDWVEVSNGYQICRKQYHSPPSGIQNDMSMRVKPGVIIELMGPAVYSKIHNAAYPRGDDTADDNALFFFERAKFPTSSDGLIDLSGRDVSGALDYFISQGYMNQSDRDRILAGQGS